MIVLSSHVCVISWAASHTIIMPPVFGQQAWQRGYTHVFMYMNSAASLHCTQMQCTYTVFFGWLFYFFRPPSLISSDKVTRNIEKNGVA